MDPRQLDGASLFVDENPDKQEDLFVDYNPDDLQKVEDASLFVDNDPDALLKKQRKAADDPVIQKMRKAGIYAPDKTPEEINQMNMQEKLAYAKQLNQEFEYRQGKGFSKGAASGATLGLSEYIPGMNAEEDDMLNGFGEFVGSTLPVSKLYNWMGKPLVSLAAKSPYAKNALMSFARMTGMGATGAVYEGTKEVIKEGKAPEPADVAKWGAQWALLDGALQAVGKGISFLTKVKSASRNAKNLNEQQVINDTISQLQKEKINPEVDPQKYADRAEKIVDEMVVNQSNPQKIVGNYKDNVKKISAENKEIPIFEMREPKVETTGVGASEHIEYEKGSVDKTIDAMNDFIKAAKTPGDSLKRLGSATNTAIFNFLSPLEKMEEGIPIPERVSTKIKMAQSATSEINSVVENGIFSNVTGNFEHGGLKEAYGDLQWKNFTKGLKPEDYSLKELNVYRHSKQAIKRQAQGFKTGIDTEIATKDIERLAQKYEPVANRIRKYNRAVLEHYGKDILGEAKIKSFDKEFETSLYRVMESGENSVLKKGSLLPKQPFKKFKGSERKHLPSSESDIYNTSMLITNSKKNEAVLQYMEGVQKGQLEGKIRKGKNNPIPSSVLDQLEIPMEQLGAAENLYNQTRKNSFTPEKNILKGWKNGQPIEIEVPEDVYEIFTTFTPNDPGPIAKFFAWTNRMFSRGITMDPRKALSIASRDALSSLIYSKTGSNPLSVFEAMGDVFGNSEAYKQFKALGGDLYASRLAERMDRAKKIEELITPGKEGIMVPFEKIGSYFKKYSKTLGDISMSVPMAEYNRALAKYGNTAEGRIMAAMEARKSTYDPNRKGSNKMVRELGNFIPFWNVSLQDLSMLGNKLQDKKTWMKGLTAIALPTMLLKMTNDGNPDYEALTPVDKAAFWHVYFGDKHIRIPIPWLLGSTFKVGSEFFYDSVKSGVNQNSKQAKEAWKGLYENFTENVTGSMPPILQNYIEMTTGKSPQSPLGFLFGSESRSPEVLPRRLQDLPPELQYTSKTSQLARWFGEHWGVSPMKLEKGIKNFGGIVAADALALIDEMAYFTGLAEDKRPEQNEKNYLLLGNFVGDSTPTRTKYANEFYEHLRQATLDKNAQRVIRERGLDDSSLSSLENDGVNWFQYNKKIGKLFKEMRSLEDDSTLSAKEKKVQLKEYQKEINSLYKEAVDEAEINKKSLAK